MLERLRTARPTTTRGALTAVLTASVAAIPASGTPARAAEPPAPVMLVLSGETLRPLPPAVMLPVRGYRLTGRYGDSSYHWRTVHTGLDFAAASGTPIRAIGPGRIVEASYDGRYGNKTVLRLADGTDIWLCHQDELRVAPGERVRAGQVIGTVGSTGNATGPHLHLEVHPRSGQPVDPGAWLGRFGLRV